MNPLLSVIAEQSLHPFKENILDYGLILPIVILVVMVATWACRKMALTLGIMDYPDGDVKPHIQPIAYLGGVGIWIGLMVGLAIGIWVSHRNGNGIPKDIWASKILLGIGIGATFVCLVGLLDDIFDIKPWQKLIGQALAASILIFAGMHLNLNSLFEGIGISLPDTWVTVLSIPLVIFIILCTTNSLNLLDGLDGLCAGVTAIISVAFCILMTALTDWENPQPIDQVRLILSLALVGGTLGFLPFNRHPAKIFMGDAGSLLLGYIVGALLLLHCITIGNWSIGAIIILGLPILDTSVAIVRRFLNKKPLFLPDRGHIYDQLVDRGNSISRSVGKCYLLAALYALIGIAACWIDFHYSLIILLGVVMVSGFLVYQWRFLNMNYKEEPDKSKYIND